MRLDSAAQRALNVAPTGRQLKDHGSGSGGTGSLLGLMGRTRTAMGKRRLRVWLKQPLVSVTEIDARLDVVEALVEDADLRERLRDQHLRGETEGDRLWGHYGHSSHFMK